MAGEETTVLGGLRTFIAGAAALAGAEVLVYYPDKVADQTKTLIRLEMTETVPTDWIGSDGPFTATPAKVDKATHTLYVVRVECWGKKTDNPGGKSGEVVALEAATAVRQRLAQNRAALQTATGLHYQQAGRVRPLPQDANFPDWAKVAVYVSAYKDEVWVEDA